MIGWILRTIAFGSGVLCACVVFKLSAVRTTGDDEERGGTRIPEMYRYYYEQRQYGNPGIDVDALRWRAWESIARDQRYSAVAKGTGPARTEWVDEGPWNIGGRVRGIAIDPTNPDVWYAGAASGGVWKTTNAGAEWMPMTDALPTLAIGAVAIDPSDPRRILAGTGEPLSQNGRLNASFIISRGPGMLRSDDAGATWTLLPWPSGSNGGVHRIAIHPAGIDTFLVASTTDLWKTTDGGTSWTRVLNGVISDVAYMPGNPSRVYAAIGPDGGGSVNGLFISDAGGDRFTWHRATVNYPATDSCGRTVIGVTPANPNRVYAAVAINGSRKPAYNKDFFIIMSSSDAGETWERKRNALPSTATNGQAWYDLAFGVSPVDENWLMFGGLHVWSSTNGGTTFNERSDGSNVHADVHCFAFSAAQPNTVVVGCDGGVYFSDNRAVGWNRRVNRLGTVQYYACAYDPVEPSKIFGGTQDNGSEGRLADDNAGWASLFGGDGGNVAVDPGNTNIRYFCSTSVDPSGNIGRPVWRTGIGSNARLDEGLNGGTSADRFTWVPILQFHPGDRTRLYTATQYLYLMKNPSGNFPVWSPISEDLGNGSGIVTGLDISEADGKRAYVVASNGYAAATDDIQAIDVSWRTANSGLPSRWLSGVTADWDNPDIAYVAVSGYGTGHAFHTTDGGASWQNISGDLPDIPANALIRSRTAPNTLFLATDLGVWYTANGGANWMPFGTGLPNVVVYDMKLTPDNVLVAGTHGRGMWTVSALVGTGTIPAAPSTLTLEQNYPNPARSTTEIAFLSAKREFVTVDLYNTAGTRVRTIQRSWIEPGRHSVRADVSDLPDGTYLCSLSAGAERRTRRFVVLH